MRARNAVANQPPTSARSGSHKAWKVTGTVRKAVRPALAAVTEQAPPDDLIPPITPRRYLVVEHLGDIKRIGRVIAEYSTLELAQAVLRSELDWGNPRVAILDQTADELILDGTRHPARVRLHGRRG